MLVINDKITILDEEIGITYIRAGGPGGQNVNKVATAAQLRFDVVNSPSLSASVKKRLLKLAGKRMTNQGELIITARNNRTQAQNREEALHRLTKLIRQATKKQTRRISTKPSRASQQRRLDSKKRHSNRKKQRGKVKTYD